jgi:hypothetical protein
MGTRGSGSAPHLWSDPPCKSAEAGSTLERPRFSESHGVHTCALMLKHFFFFVSSMTESCSVAQASLELLIFLPPEC